MKFKHLIFKGIAFFFFPLIFSKCSGEPKNFQLVLENSTNDIEFEKVISYFKEDENSQKLEAAYFLIGNLQGHYHYRGEAVQNHRRMFKYIDSAFVDRKGLDRRWDSLKLKLGYHLPGNLELVKDSEKVKARELIKHINAAFKAWEYPWCKDLSFEEFCEFILPFKIVNEEPDDWLPKIQNENDKVIDSLKLAKNSYEACLILNKHLKNKFHFEQFPVAWDINFGDLSTIKAGACVHATQFCTYYMRAMGIPVVMDFTPYWGNMNGGHDWNALMYKKKPIPFVGAESDPGKTKLDLAFQRKRGKIFRHTYSSKPNKIQILAKRDRAPSFLKDSHIIDVTDEYLPVSNIVIESNNSLPGVEYAYICVFNSQRWKPLYWGELDNGRISFKKMGRGILYIPMFSDMGDLVPAGDPVILSNKGDLETVSIQLTKKEQIVVKRKGPQGPTIKKGTDYEFLYWDGQWISAGKTTAVADSLAVLVPRNGLYWVRSSDKTSKERIFTYKNNKQIWW